VIRISIGGDGDGDDDDDIDTIKHDIIMMVSLECTCMPYIRETILLPLTCDLSPNRIG
jgi:hypothetical protein